MKKKIKDEITGEEIEIEIDEAGNEVDKDSRANKRIRELLASKKELEAKNEELSTKVNSISETLEKLSKQKDIIVPIVEEPIIENDKNGLTLIEQKVQKIELDSFKKSILATGVLSEEDLSDLKTIEEVNVAITIAKKIKDNFESQIEQKAKDKAKIIVEQEKATLEGEKGKLDDKHNKFKENLKKNKMI